MVLSSIIMGQVAEDATDKYHLAKVSYDTLKYHICRPFDELVLISIIHLHSPRGRMVLLGRSYHVRGKGCAHDTST